MGAGESSPASTAEGENVSAALLRIKHALAKGDITKEQHDAEIKLVLKRGSSGVLLAQNDASKENNNTTHLTGSSKPSENCTSHADVERRDILTQKVVSTSSTAPIMAPSPAPTTPVAVHVPDTNAPVESLQPSTGRDPAVGELPAHPDGADAIHSPESIHGADRGHSKSKVHTVDVGDGTLAIKMLRLKAMLNRSEITRQQYDATLRKLLRVRAFGCDCGADLEKGLTKTEGWMCNVCERDLPAGSIVFSCVDCNWDGCKQCLEEAKLAEANANQDHSDLRHIANGEATASNSATTASASPHHDAPFECPAKHRLWESRSSSSNWSCNLCATKLPKGALIYSCRECDWDGCGMCFSRKADLIDVSMVVRAVKQPDDPKCCAGHFLLEFCTPDSQWACDLCKGRQGTGAFMFGCRTCNWDACKACLSGEPVQSKESEAKEQKGTLMQEVLRLKGAKTAGWLTEDEYNYELKKLLSSVGDPAGKGGPLAGQANTSFANSFGCPLRHLLKRFPTPNNHWNCNVCSKQLPMGTLVFGCRACDWDGCHECLDAAREAAAVLKKGDTCWYKRPDGSLCESQIASVDNAHSPPSYMITVDGNVRETERQRLLAFLPSALEQSPPQQWSEQQTIAKAVDQSATAETQTHPSTAAPNTSAAHSPIQAAPVAAETPANKSVEVTASAPVKQPVVSAVSASESVASSASKIRQEVPRQDVPAHKGVIQPSLNGGHDAHNHEGGGYDVEEEEYEDHDVAEIGEGILG